jgi:hypothetical protein
MPERLPDLWGGRREAFFFRCRNSSGAVTVRARRPDGAPFELRVEAEHAPLPAIAQLWARARILDLEDRQALGLPVDEAELLALALRHKILTRQTAFVAVDRTEAGAVVVRPKQVVQPVPNPRGGPGGYAPRVAASDADFRPGRIMRQPLPGEDVSYRRASFGPVERDRWKRASSKSRAKSPTACRKATPQVPDVPPLKELIAALERLSSALVVVLDSLEENRWPADGGAQLSRERAFALAALRESTLGDRVASARRVVEDLEVLLESLRARSGSAADHFEPLRAAATALERECATIPRR